MTSKVYGRVMKKIVGALAATVVCVLLLGCPPKPVTPPASTCGPNDAGTCSGTCPGTQVCSQPSPTVCACMEPDAGVFCAFDKAGVCGGPCPAGQTCKSPKPTVCACIPNG